MAKTRKSTKKAAKKAPVKRKAAKKAAPRTAARKTARKKARPAPQVLDLKAVRRNIELVMGMLGSGAAAPGSRLEATHGTMTSLLSAIDDVCKDPDGPCGPTMIFNLA